MVVIECEKPLFNQPTYLHDDEDFKAREKHSTDILEYTFYQPQLPICYMQNQPMQGPQIRSLPGPLVDVESFMRQSPMKAEVDSHVLKSELRNTLPELPEPLRNRMYVPDCQSLMQSSNERKPFESRESETSEQVIRQAPLQSVIVGIGEDTRQTLRDAFAKKQRQLRPESYLLRPEPDVNCANSPKIGCMHLVPESSHESTTILAPVVGRPPTLQNIMTQDYSSATGQIMTPQSLYGQTPTYSNATIAAAQELSQARSFGDLANELMRRRGCDVRFYDWKPNC
jgi:hypothetical protein